MDDLDVDALMAKAQQLNNGELTTESLNADLMPHQPTKKAKNDNGDASSSTAIVASSTSGGSTSSSSALAPSAPIATVNSPQHYIDTEEKITHFFSLGNTHFVALCQALNIDTKRPNDPSKTKLSSVMKAELLRACGTADRFEVSLTEASGFEIENPVPQDFA